MSISLLLLLIENFMVQFCDKPESTWYYYSL